MRNPRSGATGLSFFFAFLCVLALKFSPIIQEKSAQFMKFADDQTHLSKTWFLFGLLFFSINKGHQEQAARG